MRRINDRKLIGLLAKTGAALFALVFAAALCLSCFKAPTVNADSDITVSLSSSKTNLGPGDLVFIDVVASRMPGISSFGPITFNFDADKAEYVYYEHGKEVANFGFTETLKNGEVTVTGTDRMTNTGGDINDDDYTGFFNSEEPVVLFTIALRLFPYCRG